jgi:hypothetical protein
VGYEIQHKTLFAEQFNVDLNFLSFHVFFSSYSSPKMLTARGDTLPGNQILVLSVTAG